MLVCVAGADRRIRNKENKTAYALAKNVEVGAVLQELCTENAFCTFCFIFFAHIFSQMAILTRSLAMRILINFLFFLLKNRCLDPLFYLMHTIPCGIFLAVLYLLFGMKLIKHCILFMRYDVEG